MKGEDALLWHEIMHDSKYALLHFTSILRPQNNHLTGVEIEGDTGLAGHPGGMLVGGELTSVENGEVGLPVNLELLFSRSDEHVVHKKSYKSYFEIKLK